MRTINKIVIHCSGGSQDATVESIKRYWREVNKWKTVGYHFIIDKHGIETQLAGIPQITNGVRGHNADSVHVCYIGGVEDGKPKDTRTLEQKQKLRLRVNALKAMFPHAKVYGHRDLSPDKNGDGVVEQKEWVKVCPCFDAVAEYSKG
jgi:N-acetylmuramoyl-L-alanine amidase